MKLFGKIFLSLVAAIFLYLANYFGFTDMLFEPQNVYYRATVDLEYQGKPVHFETIVGCNTLYTHPFGGVKNIDFYTDLTISAYKLPDNSGLFLEPARFSFCLHAFNIARDGRSNNPDFDKPQIPRLYWVNDFNQGSRAELYFMPASYTDPRSRLKNPVIKFSLATKREYRNWSQEISKPESLIKIKGTGELSNDLFDEKRLDCPYAVSLHAPALFEQFKELKGSKPVYWLEDVYKLPYLDELNQKVDIMMATKQNKSHDLYNLVNGQYDYMYSIPDAEMMQIVANLLVPITTENGVDFQLTTNFSILQCVPSGIHARFYQGEAHLANMDVPTKNFDVLNSVHINNAKKTITFFDSTGVILERKVKP